MDYLQEAKEYLGDVISILDDPVSWHGFQYGSDEPQMLPHAPDLTGSACCTQHDVIEITRVETLVALDEDEVKSHVTSKGSDGSSEIELLTRLDKG